MKNANLNPFFICLPLICAVLLTGCNSTVRQAAGSGLTAGVFNSSVKKLDNGKLCQAAVTPDGRAWSSSRLHVAEAKSRGLHLGSCELFSGRRAERDRLQLEAERERGRATWARKAEQKRQQMAAAWEAERKRIATEEARRAEEQRKRLEAEQVAAGQPVNISAGSGFAISKEGFVLTNQHVIDGCQLVVIHLPSGVQKGQPIASDYRNDLALLKVSVKLKEVLPLSEVNASLLDEIIVAGYPFSDVLSSSVKVTKGVVSALAGFGDDYSRIQIDAAIQPGNSGGPILNDNGNVVGVAVAKLSKKKFIEAENTNFGIKSSIARAFVDANNVKIPQPNSLAMTKDQLVELITKTTHLVSCWVPSSIARKMLESRRNPNAISP